MVFVSKVKSRLTKVMALTTFVHLCSSTVYLYTSNDPVIEASRGLKFAPFNLGYPGLRQQAEAAELPVSENKWELVFDFSALTGDDSEKFVQMTPEEWSTQMLEIPGQEPDSSQRTELVF